MKIQFSNGFKSTEFWFSVIVVVVLQLNQMGVFPQTNDSQVVQIGMTVATVIYTVCRTLIKSKSQH